MGVPMAENVSPDADAQIAKGAKGKTKLPRLTIDHWVNIAVALGALIVGAWLNNFLTNKPDLNWTASDVLPFKGDKEQIGIFNLNVRNGGSKEVEDVTVFVQVSSGAIAEAIVSPKIIANTPDIKGDNMTVVCKMLNPKDSMQVSALIRTKEATIPKPVIIVRGKSVTGYESAPQSKNLTLSDVLSLMTVSLTTGVALVFFMMSRMDRKKIVVEYKDADPTAIDDSLKRILIESDAKYLDQIKDVYSRLNREP